MSEPRPKGRGEGYGARHSGAPSAAPSSGGWETTSGGMSEPRPKGRGEGYGAREEEAGPVLAYGISASVVYGIVIYILGLY